MRAVAVRLLHTLNKSLLFRPTFISPYGKGCVHLPDICNSDTLSCTPVCCCSFQNSLFPPLHLLSHHMGNVEQQIKLNLLCMWQLWQSMIFSRFSEKAHVLKWLHNHPLLKAHSNTFKTQQKDNLHTASRLNGSVLNKSFSIHWPLYVGNC